MSQKLEKNSNFLKSLYENLASGLITEDYYRKIKSENKDNVSSLIEQIDRLRNKKREIENRVSKYHDLSEAVSGLNSDLNLTANLIDLLIEKILVSHDKSFEVHFCFADEIKEMEGMPQCINMQLPNISGCS
ncbi:MAG: hypothetical protein LBC56_02395 [Oscillospiraceae bacterium]|nr:hypothetical protein [Oscillospiraceae bacterium]